MNFRKIACILLLVIFAGLGLRLVAYTVGMETGWSTLAMHWREGVWGGVGDRRPVTQRSPREQAAFWLKTVDRVLAKHPDDAELHLAAAVILHSADWEFLNVEFPNFGHVDGVSNPVPILAKEWEGKKDEYEAECQQRAQTLATRATELDPTNVEIWRARASMLLPRVMPVDVPRGHLQIKSIINWRNANAVRPQNVSLHDLPAPRDPAWETILSQANQRDPDNALYDLLAGHFMWLEARQVIWWPDGSVAHYSIKDEDRYQEAQARFDGGLAKPHFTTNLTADDSVRRFLRVGNVSPVDLPRVKWDRFAEDRGVLIQPYDLPRQMRHWQLFSLGRDRKTGNAETILDRYRLMGVAAERFGLAKVPMTQHQRFMPKTFAEVEVEYRHDTNLIAILEDTPEIFSDQQVQEAAAIVFGTALEQRIDKLVQATEFDFPNNRRTEGLKDPARPMLILVEVLPGMIVPLVVLGGLAIFFGRPLTLGEEKPPRVWLPLLMFGLVLIGTVLYLGVSTLTEDSMLVAWVLTGVVIVVPLVLAGVVLRKMFCRKGGRFSLADLLVAIALAGIVLWTISLAGNPGQRFSQLPFDMSIDQRKEGFPGPMTHLARLVYDEKHQPVLGPLDTGSLWTVACQWIIHRGPALTLLLWLATLSIWCWVRRPSQVTTSDNIKSIGRNRWGPPLQSAGRAALVLAAIMLAGYLVYAPNVVREVEWHHQMQRLQSRSPGLYQQRYLARKKQIRSDPQLMARLKPWAQYDVDRVLSRYPQAARRIRERKP